MEESEMEEVMRGLIAVLAIGNIDINPDADTTDHE